MIAVRFVGVVSLLVGALWLADATANTACETMRDRDQRHWCRAVSTGQSTWCESIRDSDLRHYCRAVAKRDASWCNSIRSPSSRAQCRVDVERYK